MRNWNTAQLLRMTYTTTFSAYLWGIETKKIKNCLTAGQASFQRTYEELKLPVFLPCFDAVHQFSAYLWGIETKNFLSILSRSGLFSAYLWGIETPPGKISNMGRNQFSAYLWGIETAKLVSTLHPTNPVFSVPMRNWNYPPHHPHLMKQPVFSVPMRNWNSSPTGAGGGGSFVFSVPMRNWNILDSRHALISLEGFQRTYEELKLPRGTLDLVFLRGFQRTYEELKHHKIANLHDK